MFVGHTLSIEEELSVDHWTNLGSRTAANQSGLGAAWDEVGSNAEGGQGSWMYKLILKGEGNNHVSNG